MVVNFFDKIFIVGIRFATLISHSGKVWIFLSNQLLNRAFAN